ncbi:MAG TPA: alpha/beta hydrolase [Leptospiraceae bacterium]|nr:alpha/beta hydrolase [Leptospiraceae bacterium]HMX31676.1 alpha/beta hydrolase [Leptospiraceae bacterium]HMY31962.1 alpha/beta hydrolase [Leptospiraceae bacterium]HMZ63174.1 alpha/beta hydrolase [Leptospiraceae bacterium]HNA07665.1 alpha/beta hydrolase [Leptospiraceae bacterium]
MKFIMVIIPAFIVLLASIIYTQQEFLLFRPYPLAANYTYSFPFEFEELNWEVEPGIKINALHFKTKDAKGVVLYFHGNGGNLAGWGGIADDFLNRKQNLIIIDYRGYGKSTGTIKSEDDLIKDALYAYEYAKSIYPENQITLYGRSLGSGLAVYLAKDKNPKRLILETPYNNLSDIASYHYPYIPTFLLKYKLDSESMIGSVKCPIYIFHGTEDAVIPLAYARKLESKIKRDYKFFQITNAGHNDVSETKEYFMELTKIFW